MMHVANSHFKYFRCFRGTLQVFYMDVAKVYRDVAHVAMAIHVCCKRPFQMFYLPFSNVCCKCAYLDVAYVSCICCKCFIWMLCMFTMVSSVFSVFASASDACFKCFRCMLQVFYIDVAKVDRNVAHVAMAIHVCSKCLFKIFHLFQTYVASAFI